MPKIVRGQTHGHGLGHIESHLNVCIALYPWQHRVYLLVLYIVTYDLIISIYLSIYLYSDKVSSVVIRAGESCGGGVDTGGRRGVLHTHTHTRSRPSAQRAMD